MLSAVQTQHETKTGKEKKFPLGCEHLDYFQWLVTAGGSLEACGVAVVWLFCRSRVAACAWEDGAPSTPGALGARGAAEGMLSAPPPR